MADNWIQTFTGRAISIFDPKPEQYCIEDIAHALSCKNRFSGMTTEPYSIAQHCVLGARTLEHSTALALAFLLHELDEVALQDEHPTLKEAIHVEQPDTESSACDPFYVLADRHRDAALEALGLSGLLRSTGFRKSFAPEVGAVDLRMLATEKRDLLGPPPKPWKLDLDGVLPFSETIKAWPWYQVERAFLRAFDRYRGLGPVGGAA